MEEACLTINVRAGPVLASTSPGAMAGTMLGASPPGGGQRPAWGRPAPGQRPAGGAQAAPPPRGASTSSPAVPWSLPGSSGPAGGAAAEPGLAGVPAGVAAAPSADGVPAHAQARLLPVVPLTRALPEGLHRPFEMWKRSRECFSSCQGVLASAPVNAQPEAAGKEAEAAGHGRKAKRGHKQQTLLFSTTQRRY